MAQFRPRQSVDFFAYENLTVGAAATSLTAATYAPTNQRNATFAFITVETDQIRFTLDGTTPTATVGHLANVGDVIELEGSNQVARFQAIRVTLSATLRVSYGK